MDTKYRKEMANEINAIHGENFEYMQMEGAAQTVTAVTGVMPMMSMVGSPAVGPKSTELNCPQCRCRIKTKVRHRSTARTYIACLLLTPTLVCCCLPHCMDSCRNANHFCPMCGAFVGSYQS